MTAGSEQGSSAWRRLLTPWRIAAILIVAFLIVEGYLTRRDRFLIAAINEAPAFATPDLKFSFSKNIQFDPLTFVGRGARAGFWNWSPAGLQLTPQGEQYCRLEGETIDCRTAAGRRKLSRIRDRVAQDGGERVTFFYHWEELSPMTTALLSPPPKPGDDYLATAVMSRAGGNWRMISLETRDFDEPLKRLQDAAAGIRH